MKSTKTKAMKTFNGNAMCPDESDPSDNFKEDHNKPEGSKCTRCTNPSADVNSGFCKECWKFRAKYATRELLVKFKCQPIINEFFLSISKHF